MSQPIIFYDIPTKLDGDLKAWSPNTWKTRLNLNYKRIPYKTVWVEYPYIKPLYLELKQEPTTIANGKPEYTLPAIHDPNTGTFVSDSFRIAQYLDKTYPDRPLIPEGTAGLQSAFDAYMWSTIRQDIFTLSILKAVEGFNPPSEEYFRRTREASFGVKLEEFAPVSKRSEHLESLERGLGKLGSCNDTNREGAKFLMGDRLSWGDLATAAWLLFAKYGVSTEEWETIMGYGGGRWKTLMQSFDESTKVDSGEAYTPK